jgi:NAD(P)-dependent dehydrogenase (short-subunit alcohol dehydrogenase family)
MSDRLGRFDGRVALVTGAAGGLGFAHAAHLAALGASLMLNDCGRDDAGRPSVDTARERLAAIGVDSDRIATDASDIASEGAPRSVIDRALERFGRLDILINNAGVADQVTVTALDADSVTRNLAVNLRGSIELARLAWSPMTAQNYGRIVNTGSPTVLGSPVGIAYQASKAGLFGLTRSLALAGCERDIRVNQILPTAYTPMVVGNSDAATQELFQRRFRTDQVSPVVAVLAHESCPVSGRSYLVGGGRLAEVVLAVDESAVLDTDDFSVIRDALGGDRDRSLRVPKDRADDFAQCLADLDRHGHEALGHSTRKEPTRSAIPERLT